MDPWSRVHIDFVEPFGGRYLFVAVDSVTSPLKQRSCQIYLRRQRCLREVFATRALPKILVPDNGPAFVSAPFLVFEDVAGLSISTRLRTI
ncbi:hypothetical protein TTRE_0000481101 [Trichuris trichiura]|uniref:Integrase catalytic domain-containing protein n=1 Tax=Trichuris trichiura TaxID=36087 RepID=A0A077Z8J5_TRITR|nr:hypothetical protein TTRE_0000481101 [Trichuris trichiura]